MYDALFNLKKYSTEDAEVLDFVKSWNGLEGNIATTEEEEVICCLLLLLQLPGRVGGERAVRQRECRNIRAKRKGGDPERSHNNPTLITHSFCVRRSCLSFPSLQTNSFSGELWVFSWVAQVCAGAAAEVRRSSVRIYTYKIWSTIYKKTAMQTAMKVKRSSLPVSGWIHTAYNNSSII